MKRQEDALWQTILGIASVDLSDANYKMWFEPAKITSIDGETVTIAHPNPFASAQFEKRFDKWIKDILINNGFTCPEINCVVKKRSGTATNSKTATTSISPEVKSNLQFRPVNNTTGSGLNKQYTFDSFIVGGCNDLAYSVAQAVAKNPGTRHNPFFIYGGVGLGKTHLIQAAGNMAEANGATVKYLTAEEFGNDFINHITNKKTGFATKYRNVDMLIIDDIQFIAGKTKTQEEFFNTFNALHQKNKQIILSSDNLPDKIPNLTDRLRSRFHMGMVVDINLPDYETRQAIIQSKTDQLGLKLDREIVEYMAENIKTNIRELEGIINTFNGYVEMKNLTPSIDLVKIIINDIRPEPTKHFTPRQIIIKTAEYFNIKPEEILSTSHRKSKERQITMYLIRTELHRSFPEIAKDVNRKDHTTVLYGVRKIEKNIKIDNVLNEQVSAIRERLYV
ncbi:chromosomal replication initiator protein DnaA [Ruminococcaceae bacterium OttesenSCG-928-A11]|nr:chromosomal replication initiator protein DnaA [Ruminococcaceae bacterium OttesenSCG-928-A11]